MTCPIADHNYIVINVRERHTRTPNREADTPSIDETTCQYRAICTKCGSIIDVSGL